MPIHIHEDLPVALFVRNTNENLANNLCDGALRLSDFSPDGRLNAQKLFDEDLAEVEALRSKTRFGQQEAASFATTMPARSNGKPKNRPPLAPLVVRDHPNGDELEVTRRTMGATIAEQEATIEALNATIAHNEKTIELMRNLIISFCAFCQHKRG